MAVTYVSALERDTRRTSELARHVDVRHALLGVTSLVAMLLITLTYAGVASRGVPSHTSPRKPINISTLTNAAALEPALESVFPSPSERQRAATDLYQFVRKQQDAGDPIPNVGALRRATPDGGTAVVSADQLAALKPSVIVRTYDAYQQQVLMWGTVYLASVWAVALFWWARRV